MSVPTKQLGGLLDVVATRCDLTATDVKIVDVGLSDHHLLHWSVSSNRSTPVIETFVRRPWRTLDIADFQSALSSSILCQRDRWLGLDADTMASLYDTELTAMLYRALPARTVTRRPRPSDLWFDADCRAAKRLTRRLERTAIAAAKKPDASAAAVANQAWQTHIATCGIRSAMHSGQRRSQLISRHHIYCGDQLIYCWDEVEYQRATPSLLISFVSQIFH